MLCLLISAYAVNKYLFLSLFSAHFFTFFCSLLVTSLFKITPMCNEEVLSSVSKCKKAMMCLMEKIHVVDELCSDTT